MSGRYEVICYPLYYAVQDMSTPTHEIVFETRDRLAAHRKANKLNKQAQRAEQRYTDAITGIDEKARDRLIEAMRTND